MMNSNPSNTKILIVDDEADIREILQAVLSMDPKIEVHTAGNGEEALQTIKDLKIDILITDLAMPKMNGFELLRRLKVSGKTVPTIVLTGHGDKRVASQLFNYGVHTLMQKPWSNQELIHNIQKLIHLTKLSAS